MNDPPAGQGSIREDSGVPSAKMGCCQWPWGRQQHMMVGVKWGFCWGHHFYPQWCGQCHQDKSHRHHAGVSTEIMYLMTCLASHH